MGLHNWKQQLKELKLQDIAKRAPEFYKLSGAERMKIKSYSDKNANSLTAAIVDYINFKGGSATRINSIGMIRKINNQMRWTAGTTRRGTADIHAVYQGKHLSIEIKIGTDKLSPYQLAERERVRNAGGYYFTAKDFPSFLEWFEKINP